LKDILREKHRGKNAKEVLLHVNTPAHREFAVQKKLAYLGFQGHDHPPCSPDLAPSDYHLFPGLKKQWEGLHFSPDTKVIAAAVTWLDRQNSDFLSGLKRLEQRAKKCIELRRK
jgi:histone-lysine N-methyltransferase SETMAR